MQKKRIFTNYIKDIQENEFQLLLSGLKSYEVNYRLAFYIMYHMGLRIGEVVRIKKSDLRNDILKVQLEKSGRVIERIIPKIVLDELERYNFINQYSFKNEYLFPSRDKKSHLANATIQWKFTKLRRKLALDDVYYNRTDGKPLHRISPHTLRHAFLNNLQAKTKDIYLTSRIIGHQNVRTTAKYLSDRNIKDQERIFVNSL